MNFEFYMTKKETNQNKHKSKSPHPVKTNKKSEVKMILDTCTTPKKKTVSIKA